MNKLKERINQNINDAYVDYGDFRTSLAEGYLLETCKDFSVGLSLFCVENYNPKKVLTYPIIWEGYQNTRFTTEELLNLYL